MPRNLGKRRCGARARTTGQPCRRWAMHGQRRCLVHGGGSPQARRAAGERLARQSLLRAMRRAEDRQRRLLVDWWADRICYAAQVLDCDALELCAEVRERGFLVQMTGRWPPGLGPEDEPVVQLDGRVVPRGSRSRSA